ncbi:response regulator transcription factor [Paenibacillus cremeus]|uniref:Response regulator n=1 Tax=Paenibacillus cremeus TaxID=2163881 RepID=A0A559JZX3_9BACL|nr:helix-turn-helix domain-containing protein [Paenibacillus cremeus]TVY05452.1 response regulator [Paenibacillus cremeus]
MDTSDNYQVLIVDDEPLFRLALRTLITESGLPFTIAGEAPDGEEALAYKQQHPEVDLLIVDMKMPKMSGVELMREWREFEGSSDRGPVMLALSSYRDYEFVREAFLLGAIDYIVKVDMDESHVIPVLRKAMSELEKRKQVFPRKTAAMSEGTDVILKRMLTDLPEEESSYLKMLSERGVVLPETQRIAAVILPDSADFGASDAGVDLIPTVTEQALQAKGIHAEMLLYPQSEVVLLFHAFKTNSYMFLRNQLNELFTVIQRRLNRYANLSVTVGVSEAGNVFWRRLVEEARRNTRSRFFSGGGRLYFSDTLNWPEYTDAQPATDESVFAEQTQEMLTALTDSNPEVWIASFDTWTGMIPPGDEQYIRKSFADVVWKLGSLLVVNGCVWEQLPDPYQKPFVLLDHCITLKQLWSRLKELMGAVHAAVHESKASAASSFKGVLQQAKSYIEQHYGDGITLTLVSEWVGVSEGHLSKLFVKEAGYKFIDYLTGIRIEKAKELMHTGLKLYEISEQVGYPNPEHFSRVFKKEVGLSPAQYRERLDAQK